VCIFEAPKTGLEGVHGIASYGIFFASAALLRPEAYRHEMQHVKDGVVAYLLIYSGSSVPLIAALVLRGVKEGVYPIDVSPLFIALFPWTFLWLLLVQAVFEFRATGMPTAFHLKKRYTGCCHTRLIRSLEMRRLKAQS